MNAARTFVKGKISPSQIKAIHAAKNAIGMEQEDYWRLLRSYGCKDRDCGDKKDPHPTSKDLTFRQAEELLDHLNGSNKSHPSPSGRGARGEGRTKKYTDMDGRPGFANGAQLRLIDAMFAQVTKAEGEEAIEKALNSFCHRIVGVAGMRMIKGWQVEKIIKALEMMGAVKKEGK